MVDNIELNKEQAEKLAALLEDAEDNERVNQPLKDIIDLNVSAVKGLRISRDNFHIGLNEISYYCGMLTGLMNCGLSQEIACEFIINIKNMEHQENLQNVINEGNIKVAKMQNV